MVDRRDGYITAKLMVDAEVALSALVSGGPAWQRQSSLASLPGPRWRLQKAVQLPIDIPLTSWARSISKARASMAHRRVSKTMRWEK